MKSDNKIRIAIIGMGRMGITHYAIINSHPDVQIISIVDPSSLINTIFGKYINGVKIYKSYDSLLKKEDIDAALVCTPPNLNYDIIKNLGEKNIPVFCEKPFTTDKNKAEELSILYESQKLVNQVGYVNRFNDVFAALKQMLSEKLIGDIIRFKSEMFSNTITKPDSGKGWRGSHETGGGAVYEMASHAIDLVNFLVGKPDKVIGSSLTNIYSKNVEDAVSATLLYKSGFTGTIYINWSDESYRKPTNKIEIFGKEGKVLADQHSLKIYLKKENKEKNLCQGWNTLYITDLFHPVPFYVRGNEFTRQLYHFVDSIKNNNLDNICSFEDGVNTLEVIDSIFEDYKKNGQL